MQGYTVEAGGGGRGKGLVFELLLIGNIPHVLVTEAAG